MNARSFSMPLVRANKGSLTVLVSAVQSTLLLTFLLFPLIFINLILHESGHAIMNLIEGGTITHFYVHPFSFNGYVRPIANWDNPWNHVSGTLMALTISLLIFIPQWKRRSLSNLQWVMLFPLCAFLHGIGFIDLLVKSGDYYNLFILTGIPAWVIYTLCFTLLGVGMYFLISLFPLLGLSPYKRTALIVVPASMVIWGLVSMLAAHLVVPSSSIDVQYKLADEIISSANPIYGLVFGTLLAVMYYGAYRMLYRKLPLRWKTDGIILKWKDLLVPFILCAGSIALGLIAIQ